jgi:transcription elongation GreA/GreB family factor
MYQQLLAKRYELVRHVLKGSTIEYAREFLLLISKCHGLSNHDKKIMQSLAEVVHPALAQEKSAYRMEEERAQVLWTTEEGYEKVRARIEHIGTVEMVESAKEVERAREHGDLRENAEYKAAVERRSRLQAEMRMLSEQLSLARILTPEDVYLDRVGVGSVVELIEGGEQRVSYTLLGPWDADLDKQIVSYQSKLAQAMTGLQVDETFSYQGKEYKVSAISSYFDEAIKK